jgi:hypothetical protein
MIKLRRMHLSSFLTQDCDILHDSYEAEPDIEIHIAKPSDVEDGNLQHAKNPRRLQLSVDQKLFEINIHDRVIVPRNCLLNHLPEKIRLDDTQIRTIINWTANRYLRSAFPDAFNERLYAAKRQLKNIETALKREGALVTNIFLLVDPVEEINPSGKFRVIIRLTVKDDIYDQTELEERAVVLAETVGSEFRKIEGIEVENYELVPESEFSLADSRVMLRWNYDHLSYRSGNSDDAGPIVT